MTTNELDSMSLYLRDMRQVPTLSADEEARLLARLARQRADQTATRNRLVEGLQGLVIHLAQRYAHRCESLEVLDLIQEGNLGLMAAIERWHTSGESEFRTYVYAWMGGGDDSGDLAAGAHHPSAGAHARSDPPHGAMCGATGQ